MTGHCVWEIRNVYYGNLPLQTTLGVEEPIKK